MKEIPITWNMGGIEAHNLTDYLEMEQTPELKANIDRLSQVIADWWLEAGLRYIEKQDCTYEQKVQVLNGWKRIIEEGAKENGE